MSIGATFKRKRGAEPTLPTVIRVTGQTATAWTVTDAERFSRTWTMTRAELARAYTGAAADAPGHVDEIAARAPAPEELAAALQGYRTEHAPSSAPALDTAETPEQAFARLAAEAAE
jgi:ClpP class serine protease